MDGSVEGDVPHTHEKRGSEDEIRWNVTDGRLWRMWFCI
jgi:hypothetical protein